MLLSTIFQLYRRWI